MSRLKKLCMTLLGGAVLLLLSPLLLTAALLALTAALLLAAAEWPGFRRSGFPGKYRPGITRASLYRVYRTLPPAAAKAARPAAEDTLSLPGDLLLAAPDILRWIPAGEEGTDCLPGDWLALCCTSQGEKTENFSHRIREAETCGKRLLICVRLTGSGRSALPPEKRAQLLADPHFTEPDGLSSRLSAEN